MRMPAFVLIALLLLGGVAPIAVVTASSVALGIEAARGPHLPGQGVVVTVHASDASGGPLRGVDIDLAPFGLRAATNEHGDARFRVASGDVASIVVTASAGSSGASITMVWSQPKVDHTRSFQGTVGMIVPVEARIAWAHNDAPITGAAGGIFDGTTLIDASESDADGWLRFQVQGVRAGVVTYALAFDDPGLSPARGWLNGTWAPVNPVAPPQSPPPAEEPGTAREPAQAPPQEPSSDQGSSRGDAAAPAAGPAAPPVEPEVETTDPSGAVEDRDLVRDLSSDIEGGAKLVRMAGASLVLEMAGDDVPVVEEVRLARPIGESNAVALGSAQQGWTLMRADLGMGRSVASVDGASSWWIEGGVIFALASPGSEVVVVFAPSAFGGDEAPGDLQSGPPGAGSGSALDRVVVRGSTISWAQLACILLLALPAVRGRGRARSKLHQLQG